MISKRFLGILMGMLTAVATSQAAEMSVSSMSMPPGSTVTLEINGDIVGESTFGLTIMVELVPQVGAVGTLEFTVEPPIDIVQLGDPWPGAGTFSPFDTTGTGSFVLNGVVDDNGIFLAGPVTFSGAIAGFPVIASAGASGVWDVVLTTGIGASEWNGAEGLVTTLLPGTITVVGSACIIDADCDDGNDCTSEVCTAGTCSNPDLVDGTSCADDGNDCTDDVCSLGFCSHPPFVAGTACGNQTPQGLCDNADICDGAGFCDANLEPLTTECRPSIGECDIADFCTGLSPLCPVDAQVADATVCTDDGNECTFDECLGGGCSHLAEIDGTLCIDDGNECTDDVCSLGACSHPSLPDFTICADDGNDCSDDFCAAGICSHPPLLVGTSCGNPVAEGLCDNPDTCDGAGTCLVNRELLGTVCRGSTDECDPAESCDGAGAFCPGDLVTPNGTACTDDGNECSDDICTAGVCSHPSKIDGTLCIDDANECTDDVCALGVCTHPNLLDGTPCTDDGNECFDDVCQLGICSHPPAALGTVCGNQTPLDLCDNPDICDGTGLCDANLKPSTSECRASTDECDPAEFCTGLVAACPIDSVTLDGTACADDGNDCTSDSCSLGICSHPNLLDGTACIDDGVECSDDLCQAGVCSHPPTAVGAACGNQLPVDICDLPDICDGTGLCDANLQPATFECRASTDECDPAELCTGIGSACPVDTLTAEGTACTADANECTDDVCALGVCSHPSLIDGTPCTDDGIECRDDLCQAGVCSHPPTLAGTACGNQVPVDICDNPDICDGTGLCDANLQPATFECRASTDECDPAELCTGIGSACPIDTLTADGSVCTDDGNVCTDDSCSLGVCQHPANTILCDDSDPCTQNDTCSASVCVGTPIAGCRNCTIDSDCDDLNDCTDNLCIAGVCSNPPLLVSTPCGDPSSNICDNPDTCDGAGVCLPNFETPATQCRASTGECDPAEFCSGAAAACPGQAFTPDGTTCADEGSDCTTDVCNAGACIHPPLAIGAPCGNFVPVGLCDDPDTCDGAGVCLENLKLIATECRASTEECDPAEQCTGLDGLCPVDQFLADGTVCGNPNGNLCDKPDSCDAFGVCQLRLEPSGTECRPSVSVCDQAELCDGAGSPCPVDTFTAGGTPCTDDGNECTDDICNGGGTCLHSPIAPETPCGNITPTGPCDNADACDGLGACLANLKPSAAQCRASTDECDPAEVCTGFDDQCPADQVLADGTTCSDEVGGNDCTSDVCQLGICIHPPLVAGTSCGITFSEGICDNPDTCDDAGVCLSNHEPGGTLCSPSTDPCVPETFCSGLTSFCFFPPPLPDGTPCPPEGDDGNDCTSDLCFQGVCGHFELQAGTPCGDETTGVCDNPDSCDGSGVCLPNFEPVSKQCRAAATDCDSAEFCTGSDGTCPADQPLPDNSACTDDGIDCTNDVCIGGACSHPSIPDNQACVDDGNDCTDDICFAGSCNHPFWPTGTFCGDPASTDCDNRDTCDGGGVCLANFEPDTTVCRTIAGACDKVDFCTGDTADCPPDGFLSSATVCRPIAGTCDTQELCTGTSASCPIDGFAPNTTNCRLSSGPCDVSEFCTGSLASCPADSKEPTTTVCRPAAGDCDIPDSCDGVSDGCPTDVVESAATVCRPQAGACDLAEFCDGITVDCSANVFAPATAVCRPAINSCDDEESCSGVDGLCPADQFLSDGTACTEGGSDCTEDTCLAGQCINASFTGACCIAGSCQEILSTNCLALGGTCLGEGTVCGVVTACCLPDGSCDDTLEEACCEAVGGVAHPAGSICLGDINPVDGVDDLCVRATLPCELEQITATTSALGDNFGTAVGISGDRAIVGAPRDDNAGANSGAAFVFRREGVFWVQEAELAPLDAVAGDQFGVDVAIDGSLALVGAWFDSTAATGAGAAYVYRLEGTSWVEEAQLFSDDIAQGDSFGEAVSLKGDLALVGAKGNDDGGSGSGSAYVFRRTGTSWLQEQKLVADGAAPGDLFGRAVSVGVDLVIVGAPGDDDGGPNAGAVYVFRKDALLWVQEAKIVPGDVQVGDEFGDSVSIEAGTVVVGARLADDLGTNSGAVYVFTRTDTSWSQQAKITAFDGEGSDLFGVSVSLNNDLILVGAPGDDDAATGAGASYIYSLRSGNWVFEEKLTASTGASGDQLGEGALSVDSAIVGAKAADTAGGNSGTAFVFALTGSDCQPNGILDACEIREVPSRDCDGEEGVLDSCEPFFLDADGDSAADICDICSGPFPGGDDRIDTDGDGVPDCGGTGDNCRLPNRLQEDCEPNGIGDVCDIADCLGDPACGDCNVNGIPDSCDIASLLSLDVNGNGIPDECEECDFDTECDDSDGCTVDTCVNGGCSFTPRHCDDGNVCTDDICTGGACSTTDNTALCNDNKLCTTGDVCGGGSCAGTLITCPGTQTCDTTSGICRDCLVDGNCDDSNECTDDTCVDNGCVFTPNDSLCDDELDCTIDTCGDNGCEFAPNDSFCNDEIPCTDDSCDLVDGCVNVSVTCQCEPPVVSGVGSRYLAIRPRPDDISIEFLVTSPNFPCLSKFVGYLSCGPGGDDCQSDADCNACTGTGGPCFTTTDCKTCSDQVTFPCVTDLDCSPDATCSSIQTCSISGLSCTAASTLPTIDIDADGIPDGTLATLVDDPFDALSLTPAQWTGEAQPHCSLTKGSCTTNAHCDSGRCLLVDGRPSGVACSVIAKDCASGFPCQAAEICIIPAVYVTGRDVVPSELINEVKVDTVYNVQAQCGELLTSSVSALMPVWGDIANGNDLVNVTDVAFLLLVFQQRHDAARGITLVATDLTNAAKPCETDQLVNAADLQRLLKAFKRETYTDQINSTSGRTGCSMPCP